LVLLLAWETLFPTMGFLPVTWQTRAMCDSNPKKSSISGAGRMRQPDRTEAELLSGFSSPKSLAAQETRQIDVSCEKPVTIHDAGQGVQELPLNSTPMLKQYCHNLLIILRIF
jgi:hypothetical protein